MRRRSSALMTLDFFCGPAMTLSIASSTSSIVISVLPLRTASSALSFSRFSRSAPVKPAVSLAIVANMTSTANGLSEACTLRISSRPLASGRSTTTRRSKRPGRNRAGSRTSGRFVAARMMMPLFASKPSISTSSWFKVCSRSSLPPPMPAPRWRPTASISSMNTMHGAYCFACANRSLTRLAPTPTNISTNSEPDTLKNGTLASPEIARASSVFPQPGRSDQQRALGDLGAHCGELFRVLEVVDEFACLFLGLIQARNILERYAWAIVHEQLGLALAESEHLVVLSSLHALHHEEQEPDQKHIRQDIGQQHHPDTRLRLVEVPLHTLCDQQRIQAGII